jgi:hypothetical protein
MPMPLPPEPRTDRIRREHAFAALDQIRASGEFNMMTDASAIAERLVWDDLVVDEEEALRFLSLWREAR